VCALASQAESALSSIARPRYGVRRVCACETEIGSELHEKIRVCYESEEIEEDNGARCFLAYPARQRRRGYLRAVRSEHRRGDNGVGTADLPTAGSHGYGSSCFGRFLECVRGQALASLPGVAAAWKRTGAVNLGERRRCGGERQSATSEKNRSSLGYGPHGGTLGRSRRG
jgi:hypothetical protein